jgi:hypothetical protein
MATKDINAEIQDRIAAFAEELSGLVREAAVEAVQNALAAGGATRAPRKPGRPAKRSAPVRRAKKARSGKRIRRTQEELDALADTFMAHVKANGGERLEQIGAALNIPTSEFKRPVQQLIKSKALRTTGVRRGTVYFAGRASGPVAKRKKKAKAR